LEWFVESLYNKEIIIDKTLEKYYEARMELFASQGWKDLCEDVKGIVENINDVRNLNNIEQLYFKKGELSILEWFLSLEGLSRDTYDRLLEGR
jgi:hypothetical protein